WSLNTGEVQIWAAPLVQAKERQSELARTLSPDETARAERFHFDRDRNRFIAGRGLLRAILGRYLGLKPAQLAFEYTVRGKPAVHSSCGNHALHFNLAHSDDLALFALTSICRLGIDVERIRPLSDADGIANRFFSARESEGLRILPAAQKPAAFFNLWTRKEA